MMEAPRVGLPNLVGQGELVARTRGAVAGAENAARAAIAAGLQTEAVQRAEHLPAAHRVEALGKDPQQQHGQGGQGSRRGEDHHAAPDDPEDGHLVDVTA
jgi:hypothetical protein